jgi:hypothetical protein
MTDIGLSHMGFPIAQSLLGAFQSPDHPDRAGRKGPLSTALKGENDIITDEEQHLHQAGPIVAASRDDE